MNEYLGKVCPYCKTPFRPDDEVVVCSQCEMPHHKDCWVENQGCTTFGCLGTIKAAEDGAPSVTATQMQYEESRPVGNSVFCTRCGARNSASDAFCFQCGNRLQTVQVQQPPAYAQVNNNTYQQPNNTYAAQQQNYNYQSNQSVSIDEDVQRLVGTNTEYYIPKFQKMKAQNKQTSWNWPAFLVTPYWMIYRKMYGFGAAVLAVDLFVSLVGSGFISLLAFCGYIALGILGNNLYMKHLEEKADRARAMSEPYKSQYITANSGVNTTATILTIIGRTLLVSILTA